MMVNAVQTSSPTFPLQEWWRNVVPSIEGSSCKRFLSGNIIQGCEDQEAENLTEDIQIEYKMQAR